MSTEETSLAAWKMAVKNRKVAKGLIFHSDRGVQYASNKFVKTTESYGVIRRKYLNTLKSGTTKKDDSVPYITKQ